MKNINRPLFLTVFSVVFLILAGMQPSNDIHGKVVCFGDSITYGAQVDGRSWVYYLSKDHPGIDFINAGRNGRKTADKKELIPVLKKNPDVDYFLIFLGVNDLKDGTEVMVDQCVKNMKWMVSKVRETNGNIKIVLLSPTDINLKTMARVNVKKKYNVNTRQSLVSLENRYKELAREESVQFLSLLNVVAPPNYADGLHPNIAGQKQIEQAVWGGLNKLYQ